MKFRRQKPVSARRPPFTGEEMTCVRCGTRTKSDPRHSLGWRCIESHDGILSAGDV